MKRITNIDENLLSAYAEGRTGPEDTMRVIRALERDPRLREELGLLRSLLDGGTSLEIPAERLAADSRDASCAAACERRILRDRLGRDAFAHDENTNLTQDGMPLYAIGGWLALNGMSVARRYDATEGDIREELSLLHDLIAVVDSGTLNGDPASGTLHAIVPLEAGSRTLLCYDPAKEADVRIPTGRFLAAWDASRRYLVSAALGRLRYRPHPANLDDEILDDGLGRLMDTLSENIHEIWAAHMMREGWTNGDALDASGRHHPEIVPFSDLPDATKGLCREMAAGTLKLVQKLGFRIVLTSGLRCTNCGCALDDDALYCPCCGKPTVSPGPEL